MDIELTLNTNLKQILFIDSFFKLQFFAFNRFYFLTTLFLLYSFCNMHKVQIQYAIQYAICNTKYNMHKVYIYTLQRFLSAQLVSIYEERIHF